IVDGRAPHEDMPAGQALPVLEWGINLVIALRYHCYLMLHAAVLERGGRALLLPAWPGHGKTTLCAALAHRGWRLFSDEFGLVRPGTRELVPIPRPMPLKNASIDVIRRFAPEAFLGPVIPGTRKGTIAHVRPPAQSVARARETAPAAWIVFPRWEAGATLSLEEMPKSAGYMQLATNAFNYEMLGEPGFETARGLVDGARCYRLVYSDLDEAVAALGALTFESGA
ncbi:MAG TPA: HprK-related kinase A, partial [Steroidobacteraceae bacterium]|nr:HprK-related kinase A [Steroidobacteraceae bacterium]